MRGSAVRGVRQPARRPPGAEPSTLTGLVARLPQSMTGIGLVLLVSGASGSFGRAGWWRPCYARRRARGPAVGPGRGPGGSGPGARGTAVGYAAGPPARRRVRGARLAAGRHGRRGRLVAGLCFTPTGGSVRARWSHRLRDSPLLDTAFAIEAVVDELTFVVGPVLVTFLATAVDPAAGLVVCAVLGVVGALAPRRPDLHRAAPAAPAARGRPQHAAPGLPDRHRRARLLGRRRGVRLHGGRRRGLRPRARRPVLLGRAADVLGGRVAGGRCGRRAWSTWRRTPLARWRVGAVALAVTLLPMPFVGPAVAPRRRCSP